MRRLRGDDGSITPLLLGFVAILVGLVAVITDSSAAFLARRSLVAASDGAALYAAGALDRDRLYDESLTRLPIEARSARSRATAYLARTDLDEHYRSVRVRSVDLDPGATSVTVELTATVALPFVGRISGGRRTLRITASSTAHSPLR
ncbi:putative Flp pilus-assembly TadE/G-like protein [Motilibacter peucedani]|uniref:Putative Flp pilus-assembly TadE/G-like protein n=1 Tax=Motilibacter peucedani TaxID=598650 RepID=A0A420XN25_9ACTN|nr:pilus assembly protein TadG-related protein [Motilibacter peucedani]RKS72681.1 putative Flp pilus-assembly TadE/G-like protein [Motilibacter peucedani]